MELTPELGSVPAARSVLRRAVDGTCPEDVKDRAELVVTELVTNAVEASGPGDRITVEVDALSEDVIEIRVANRSAARLPTPPAEVAPTAARGRGLLIVERLSDELRIDDRGDRVVVRATLRPR